MVGAWWRCVRSFFLVAGVLSLLVTSADAQTSVGKQAWKRFTADNGTAWRVEWSEAGDQARRLRGEAAPLAGDPEMVAVTFLSKNADVLGIRADVSDLAAASVRESLIGHHVTYQQSHGGLPVFNGFVDVHVKKGGSVFLVHNDSAPAAALAAVPAKTTLSPADAVWLAQSAHFNTPVYDKAGNPRSPASTDLTEEPELGIQRVKQAHRLAYRLTVGAVRYIVDATSGDILETTPLVQSATGSGRVFNPNPVNTLNDATLTDQANTNYADLADAYSIQTLRNIVTTGSGATLRYHLRGPYVRTFDVTATNGGSCMSGETEVRLPPPARANSSFLYNRGQAGFEHTMVYFHIDTSQRYIQALGFNNLWNRSIRVDAHAITPDNSFYCPIPSGAGYLAFGDGGVDDAEDADVILHEYGHALQDAASGGRYLGTGQAGAMGEGFGDYWAFTGRPTGTFAACFAEWDGQGTCLRRLNTNKKFPTDYVGQIHTDGEIWSRGLRDLHIKLGRNVANKLILQSHFLIPTSPTFTKGLRALLDADEALFPNNSHKDDICATFGDRGIRAPECGYWITLRWNKLGADVDLWLTPPAGDSDKCFWFNPNPDWGVIGDASDDPLLYRDCITDCTFEQITVDTLTTPGTYTVQAHYFSDHDLGSATATIEVYRGAQRLFRGSKTLTDGQEWTFYEIVIAPGAKPQFVEVDRVTSDPDAARRLPRKQP